MLADAGSADESCALVWSLAGLAFDAVWSELLWHPAANSNTATPSIAKRAIPEKTFISLSNLF
jgi:hypothetical protein